MSVCLCVIYLSVNCTTMQFKLYMIYLFAHIQRFESEALGMFLNVKDEFILYTCSMNTFFSSFISCIYSVFCMWFKSLLIFVDLSYLESVGSYFRFDMYHLIHCLMLFHTYWCDYILIYLFITYLACICFLICLFSLFVYVCWFFYSSIF